MQEIMNKIRYGQNSSGKLAEQIGLNIAELIGIVVAGVLVFVFSRSLGQAFAICYLLNGLKDLKEILARGMAMQVDELRNTQELLRKLEKNEGAAVARGCTVEDPWPTMPVCSEPTASVRSGIVSTQAPNAGRTVAVNRESTTIVCPLCGTEQNANRNCCHSCGASFRK